MIIDFLYALVFELRLELFDIYDDCCFIYAYYRFHLFEKKWTKFRFFRILVGWCLGISPAYYLFLFFLLCLFIFLRLFRVLVEVLFIDLLFVLYKEKPGVVKRLNLVFSILLDLLELVIDSFFEGFLIDLKLKLNYIFSIDFVKDMILLIVSKVGDFIAEGIFLFDGDLEKLYNWAIRFFKNLKRKKPYYIYLVKFFWWKVTHFGNWVLFFSDVRKIIIIFKYHFFIMSYYDIYYRMRMSFIWYKAWLLVFYQENFLFFYFCKIFISVFVYISFFLFLIMVYGYFFVVP